MEKQLSWYFNGHIANGCYFSVTFRLQSKPSEDQKKFPP